MSERTTGRKMLADLDKRVGQLEGDLQADPMAAMRRELAEAHRQLETRIAELSQRLAAIEDKLARAPAAPRSRRGAA